MVEERAQRADARRNALAVIEAARELFADQGIDVSMEDVGRAAGVGKGTLYRHFPTRDHLLAAVSRERFARLTTEAQALLTEDDPAVALGKWLRDYDRSAQHFHGMRAVEAAGIADERSAIFADCAPMKARAKELLERAKEAGAVRKDTEITSLLSLVAALPDSFRDEEGSSELIDVILRGIEP